MNETASAETNAAADADAAHDRRLRTAAKVGVGLLIPTAIISIVLSLMTERAADCIMNGNQCSNFPAPAIFGAFHVAAALGLFAAVCPRERLPFPTARSWGIKLQWLAQLTLAMLLLASP